MNFTFLSTKWNCVFIAIMVILIIAIIAEKIKQNPKNWTWANVYKTIKGKLSKSVVLYLFRWILVLSMGALGYIITDNANTFWFYIILGFFVFVAALGGGNDEDFVYMVKIGLLLQMIGLGIMVLTVLGWKLALIFIPLALIGWALVPENYRDMPWN